MKYLVIPRTRRVDDSADIASALDAAGAAARLDQFPWPSFPSQPNVSVRVAHSGDRLLVEFRISEEEVLAEKTATNSQVSEDSCVELFLQQNGYREYYNIEMSCIGTCLVGFGSHRGDRQLVGTTAIDRIRRASSLGCEPFARKPAPAVWTLSAIIPVSLFADYDLDRFDGQLMRGNFYKCGDHLAKPHYATWNPVVSRTPDYHRPESFGEWIFQ